MAVPVDGATLVLARDPELGSGPGSGTWGAWLVDQDGEHASPTVDVGFIRPRDYAAPMVTAALAAIREEMTRPMTQETLEGVGGRIPAARVTLAPGEYVTAAPMPNAPSARLMVLSVGSGTVSAAPHGGGSPVKVCTRGACQASGQRATACARKTAAWHPIPAPVEEGLF